MSEFAQCLWNIIAPHFPHFVVRSIDSVSWYLTPGTFTHRLSALFLLRIYSAVLSVDVLSLFHSIDTMHGVVLPCAPRAVILR